MDSDPLILLVTVKSAGTVEIPPLTIVLEGTDCIDSLIAPATTVTYVGVA